MKAMLFTKPKAALAIVLALGIAATGAIFVTVRTSAGQNAQAAVKEKQPAADKHAGTGDAAKQDQGEAGPAARARKPQLVDAGAAVNALAWSPDGKSIATQVVEWSPTRDGGTVQTGRALQIRDAETGAVRRTLYDEPNVGDAQFSPDGKSVAATLAGENVVKLWDPVTGKKKKTFEGAKVSLGTIAFSRDGRFLAASGYMHDDKGKRQGMVILWEAGSGKVLWQVRANEGAGAEVIALSPDGKLLATGDRDAPIKLWDTATGKCKQTLRGSQEHKVFSLAFSPDGKLLASGGLDGTVRLWDPESAKLKEFRTSGQFLKSGYIIGLKVLVGFSPDGKWLAVGGTALGSGEHGWRADVRLFDARTGKFNRTFPDMLRNGVSALAFSPSGETLAVGNWNKQLLLLPLQK